MEWLGNLRKSLSAWSSGESQSALSTEGIAMSFVSKCVTDLRCRVHQSAWTRGRVAHGSHSASERSDA